MLIDAVGYGIRPYDANFKISPSPPHFDKNFLSLYSKMSPLNTKEVHTMTDKNKENITANLKTRFSSLLSSLKDTLSPTADQKLDKAAVYGLLRAAITYFLKKSVIILVSYLFGSAAGIFDTYPFGLALLCSASKDIIFIYAGLVVSSLTHGSDSPLFFFIYTAAIGLRFAFSRLLGDTENASNREKIIRQKLFGKNDPMPKSKLFAEPVAIRLVSVILCSLSVSLARLISDGFLYYDLFALITCVLASPLLCFSYYALTDMKSPPKQLAELCAAVAVFSVIYSIKLYYVLGFSASTVCAFLITLYTSKRFGVLRGTVVGLFSGLACGASAAPMFALVGFASGALYNLSLFGAVGASVLTGVLFGVSQSGFSAFTTLLPELGVGGAVFLPLAYYDLLPKPEMFKSIAYYRHRESEKAVITNAILCDNKESLEEVSTALDSLSKTIALLSDRLRRPDILDIKEICDKSFEPYCRRCSLAPVCYGREVMGTYDLRGKFTNALSAKGKLDMSDIPEYAGEKCFNILKIVSDVNMNYAKHLESLIRDDRTEVFAIDYKIMSKLIGNASKVNDLEYEFDRELSAKLMRAIRYMDFDAESVYVYGKRKKHIRVTGINLSQVKLGAEEIKRAFENVCEARLSPPVFEIDEDIVSMSLSSERGYDISHASASTKKENSDVNGDSAMFFESRDGKFYHLISDGMGSGKEAALTSRLCTMFLSKLLSAGCESSIVIEMLNGFIRSRRVECSAGIDLAELDLVAGKGCFIKSGAAPSYIIREKNLYKLQSKTLPIGILKDTDAEVINFELHEGDIIVMFSDGVASSLEDGAWLTELLALDFESDLEKMAQKVLEAAGVNNIKSDDMTVGIMKVSKRGE